MSPEASEPLCQLNVPSLLLRVSESRKHPWRRFPGDSSLGVEVPHGLARFFEFAKNLSQNLGSVADRVAIFDSDRIS
jgi:hypothetical protein